MTPLISILFLLTTVYALGCFLLSRRHVAPPEISGARRAPFTVFVVPCLDEELVIGRSLDRLLALPGDAHAVLVVDDGSEDGTAAIVRERLSDRVWLLQRTLPEARRGKGQALNAAYRHIRDGAAHPRLAGLDPDDVVVVVVDADGRVEPDMLEVALPWFDDPRVGAVQIGVRMYNAHEGLLPRMQDMEFVTYLDIFQRARHRLGSAGLGGNGQLTRLSALMSLGDAPWTDCLTEDLDLGVRLLAGGWRNAFCADTHVSQQAVTDLERLVRQRTRWFQGHLQCIRLIPTILRSPWLHLRASLDLCQNLLGAILVLATSIACAGFVAVLSVATVRGIDGLGDWFRADELRASLVVAGWYLLAFGLAPVYAWVYSRREPSVGIGRALLLGHLYSLYGYLWFVCGWRAVGRIVAGRGGWAKTRRTVESAPTT